MVESAIAFVVLASLSLVWGFLYSKSQLNLGKERSRRRFSDLKSERIIRGIEKLMDPRPTRNVLIKHWERRLSKAIGRDVDTSLSDTNDRDDKIPKG